MNLQELIITLQQMMVLNPELNLGKVIFKHRVNTQDLGIHELLKFKYYSVDDITVEFNSLTNQMEIILKRDD